MKTDLLVILPIVISIVALVVSAVTMWLTHMRRGTVRVTQPSQIYLGPDSDPSFSPKVFIQTLLYSTSLKGRCVEYLFVKLRRGEATHNFSIWVHGSKTNLVRASGILVGPNGVDNGHHFLLSENAGFQFKAGDYLFELHMKLAGDQKAKIVFSQKLSISESEAALMNSPMKGLFFDWGPESESYQKTVLPTESNINIPGLSQEKSRTEEIDQ